jgi:hypothetical protein
MPTLTCFLEAMPVCPKAAPRTGPISNMRNTKACLERLHYQHATNDWRCPQHGAVVTGAAIGLARAGYAVRDGEVLAA